MRHGDEDVHVAVRGQSADEARQPVAGVTPAAEDLQRDVLQPCRVPRRLQLERRHRVVLDVDRHDLVGADRLRVSERVRHLRVERLDQQDHDRSLHLVRVEAEQRAAQLLVLALVLTVHPHQHQHHHRDEDHHRPRAVGELRDRDHDRDDGGREGAHPVDREADPPAGLPETEVALGHAGLGERERREHPDRVERDQLGHVGLEQHDQDGGRDGESDDPVREDQAVPADRELSRHEVVRGVEVRQAGEVGERRVGREDQDQRGGGLEREEQPVAERPLAEDRTADLRDDRLRLGRQHVQLHRDEREAQEHQAEQAAHPHERGPGVLPFDGLERRDAVRDGLDPGHGGTARRERFQDDEERHGAGGTRRRPAGWATGAAIP